MEEKYTSGQQYARVMELLKSIPLDQVMIGISSWLKSQDSEVVSNLVYLATRELGGRKEEVQEAAVEAGGNPAECKSSIADEGIPIHYLHTSPEQEEEIANSPVCIPSWLKK